MSKKILKVLLEKRKSVSFFLAAFIVFLTWGFSVNIFKSNLTQATIFVLFLILAILCSSLLFIAGKVVFKALFVVSAGLSLMIFLAQSYCDLPVSAHTADSALKFLFGFGLVYIGYLFLESLQVELAGGFKELKDPNGDEKLLAWVAMILFTAFIAFFVWELYRVMNPLVSNLCIYKLN